MSTNNTVRSISQEEANNYLVEFLENSKEKSATYAELANALEKKFQASSNQISGIIHRAHKDKKGRNVLVKTGKIYSLINMDSFNTSLTINNVKQQILEFKNQLDKTISLNDINSEKEFIELKELLKRLEELSK